MGGVDTHDQLRLQSYSRQQCVAFKKYYRQLFLGFVDMTVVNGFILHKLVLKKRGCTTSLWGRGQPPSKVNMNAEELVSVPILAGKHSLRNNSNKYRRKCRQHSCKVCSAMAEPKTKSYENSFYCPSCELLRGDTCRFVRRFDVRNWQYPHLRSDPALGVGMRHTDLSESAQEHPRRRRLRRYTFR
ncbi:hypothetical protein PHPALM_30499 [Phytophthora palmivora]|uniref:PiggyBac transposable element-derived protein domain-containing protein n=1 Tax=Phytophthora palmivora TaxID=4796 RepID=A0A2P4X505_9STRA|nr:hypothetical protein PHPALM_30499 [Phytophthora palmivora]